MMSRRMVVSLGIACCLGSISAATEPSVKPVGIYPLGFPGLPAKPDGKPRAMLWCQGSNLIGVVVTNDKSKDCGSASQRQSVPSALLLRDGRCDSDGGTVSFGFLLPRKAWTYEAAGRAPVERTVWLLHRFEGSLKAGQLKGVLVQVDVNHPGYQFQKTSVEAQALSEEQGVFTGESAWRGAIAQAFCLATAEP